MLEAFPDGSIATRLNPPGGKPTVDMSTAYRILDYLATFDGAGKTAIRDEVKGRAEIISATLAAIGPEGKGWISIERQGRGYSCRLTATGREERKARGQAAYGQGGST